MERRIKIFQITQGGWAPNKGCLKQAAVGPQGPGGTLNQDIVQRSILKASVSNESWINKALWYRLVGLTSYYSASIWESGVKWYADDSLNLREVRVTRTGKMGENGQYSMRDS
jgi:hypothetical protein